jgi:hypothetical protein
MSDNLTLKRRRGIAALLTSKDITEAAKIANVSRDTIYRWLRDPVFNTALNEATKSSLENLSRRMLVLGDKAADTLEDALTYDIKAPAARVQAARAIVSAIPQLRELANLEDRITELEKAVQK